MKTPDDIIAAIRRRLSAYWHTDLTGDTHSWPHDFALGNPTKQSLQTDFATLRENARQWRTWADQHATELRTAARRVHTTTQTIPTHLTVPDLDTAAAIAGTDWPQRLTRNRNRHQRLTDHFADRPDHARLLRATDAYTDIDFALLCDTATWFATHDATGLTPRQVPIEGLHAKWLNSSRHHVLHLSGKTDLGLLPPHPARIHFTYLDPGHRAAGHRTHDSATVADNHQPAYQPRVVLISENKDTAIHFPPIEGGIAVEGAGFGGTTAAGFTWLVNAPRLYYWGDIDTHGYEILNGYRAAGVPVTSILMDPSTYATYRKFGTSTDKNGNPLTLTPPKPLPHLTETERSVYQRLTDTKNAGHRRIEQERIPLHIARDAVTEDVAPGDVGSDASSDVRRL